MRARNIVQMTPVLGVSDIDLAIAFYTEILGFSVWRNGDYAYLECEEAGIRLLVPDAEAQSRYNPILVYVDVRDVDDIFDRIRLALETLSPDRWHGPKDQPYEMRELIVRDPDGNIITFGQGIAANAKQWDNRL